MGRGNAEHQKPNAESLNHAYCVIMAGGKGERFWPLSASKVPKPFLKLLGSKTMIQHTVERVRKLVPLERILVVIGETHLAVAKEQLPDLPSANFIVEPEGRDTAACIGFAAITLLGIEKNAVMVVLPADHYIPDMERFAETVARGVEVAGRGDYLVTIGIEPVRPETGYGYIKARQPFRAALDGTCLKVEKFVEKPDLKRAAEYLAEGDYYWNAGMFIWQVKTVLMGVERYMPELYTGLLRLRQWLTSRDRRRLAQLYRGLTRVSIDYGLMERADNVLMIPGKFRWDDVGTWASLQRVLDLDNDGNYTSGQTISVDTKDSVVYGDGIVVGTIGVSNLVIVASANGVLVCDAKRAQEVREIARLVEAERDENKE